MNIQVCPYSMTSTMQIVQTFTPHCLTGENIQLSATSSRWKFAEFYLYMAFKHKGIYLFLLFG